MANKDTEKKKKTTTKKVNNRINKPAVVKKEKKEEVNKEVTFSLIEVIIIMFITAVFGILIGLFVSRFRVDFDIHKHQNKFDELYEVYDELMQQYYKDIDGDELIEAAIKGMFNYLDEHSEYISGTESSDFEQNLDGEFSGLGVTISTNDKNQIYIMEVFENSPAEKSGLKAGDVFLKVDGEDVSKYDIQELSNRIKGKEGTTVDLVVLRDGKEVNVTFTRGKVVLPSVSYNLLDNKVGYVYVSIFASNTKEQFEVAMDSLIDQGAKSFIIDLRDNYGGYLATAQEMSSLFLEKGSVIYQHGTDKVKTKVQSTDKRKYNVKMVILVNENSASGAELMTAALNENLNTIVVGKTTYGKGTVQKLKELSNGAVIKYTVEEWFTPKGNSINKVGFKPTYEIDNKDGNDYQMQKAIELMTK